MKIRNIATSLQGAAATAGAAARKSADAVAGVPGHLASALPDRATLKSAVGSALVTGGKLLIDPKGTVGEVAVRMGENLRERPGSIRHFVIVLDDAGSAQVTPFGSDTEARAFFDAAWQEHRRAYLCDVSDGPR